VFFNGFQFTGDDFFADKNVCGIVLEIPNSALGPKQVGLWHRTLMPSKGTGGGWVQVERGARPLQLMLVYAATGGAPHAYLAGEPSNDAKFVAGFAHALEHTGGYVPEEAIRLARTMLNMRARGRIVENSHFEKRAYWSCDHPVGDTGCDFLPNDAWQRHRMPRGRGYEGRAIQRDHVSS
jgi:hypothetical protein